MKGQESQNVSNHKSDEELPENVDFPFVKTYPVWKTREFVEVFKSMTQQPHFRALEQENEYLREGEAIGYMLSFLSIIAETRNIHLDEPKSFFEDRLSALIKLEGNGLNVESIRSRLHKSLQVSDTKAQLDGDLKQVEGKIIEDKHEEAILRFEVDKLDENIRDFEESISKMKQKRELIGKEYQEKYNHIAALQEKIHETEKNIRGANIQFTRVAADPW
ncbi:hypothetical protein ACHQM5_029138 [Ranunculus cassubicifolius]